MKTKNIIIAVLLSMIAISCFEFSEEDDGINPNRTITFWTDDLVCADTKITIAGQTEYMTEEYTSENIECNAPGTATFELLPGVIFIPYNAPITHLLNLK